METPVLSKKQQKLAMSSKKKKLTVKNVLVTPYKNYWPMLVDNDVQLMQDVLNNNLELIKAKKMNIPWKELKNIPKLERKAFCLKRTEDDTIVNNKEDKKQLLFGINETARALEKNNVKCILITSDVTQQIMVKHVIDMAVIRNVATLVVPNLSNIVKEKTGITSAVFGFKANVNNEKYFTIIDTVTVLAKKYPVPKQHVNFERSLLKNNEEESFCDISNIDIKNQILFKKELKFDEDEMSIDESQSPVSPIQFYLFRENKNSRIFLPELSDKAMEIQKLEQKSTKSLDNFLSFSTDEPNNKKTKLYQSLKVNKVKNNIDRNREKVARLKRKL